MYKPFCIQYIDLLIDVLIVKLLKVLQIFCMKLEGVLVLVPDQQVLQIKQQYMLFVLALLNDFVLGEQSLIDCRANQAKSLLCYS